MVLVKIHQIYREVVAVCDSDILGKKFEDNKMQIEINKEFYGGDEMQNDKVLELLKEKNQEDACFNFVGKQSIKLAIQAGIVDKDRVIIIQNIPHAMSLI